MSSIYNRDGVYYYRGFGKRFSLGTSNRKMATALKKQHDERLSKTGSDKTLPQSGSDLSFETAMMEYLKYKHQKFAYRTYRTDLQRLTWINNFLGDHLIKNISLDTILEYVEYRSIFVKYSTIRIDLICWKAFLNYCCKRKYISTNPFTLYPIKSCQNRIDYLSLEQVQTLQVYTDTNRPWLSKLLRIAMVTGFRRGELATLSWRNITLNSIIVTGKTGQREFPNGDRIQSLLDSIPRQSQWIFYNPTNPTKHLGVDTISHAVKEAFRQLQFPESYCLNTLRHTFASHLALQGVPIQQISVLMGHKDIKTTLIYSHLLPQDCIIKLPY